MQIGNRIRAMSGGHWLAVFGLILAAWGLLFAMALSAGPHGAGRFLTVGPDMAGLVILVSMWALMSAAMMAPTFLPALAVFDDIARNKPDGKRRFGELLAGYLGIWLGFSLLAAVVQLALVRAGLLSLIGDSRSLWFSAALLAVAGGYQFSALKTACASKCREPFAFFLQYWSDAPGNAARMGLRLGVICLGCCWALMLLAFVGGTMNILWMGFATLVMVTEKLPDIGRYVTRPLGMALLGAAVLFVGRALGLI